MHTDVEEIDQDRRMLLGAATLGLAAAGTMALMPSALAAAADPEAIRPFHVKFKDEQLKDLHRRVAATRWPDRETVSDDTQGVRLDTIQKVAKYWRAHDWQGRGTAELLPAVHDRDRRAGHSLHPCEVQA